jgi:peptidoglycan/xylan/chitin deacetylase (PgdA/CDA1 family)
MPQPSLIPILIYHSLAAEATPPYRRYSMDPGRFSEHMEHIAASGFQSLTVGQLVTALAGPAESMPERPLVITFDDGFEDMHSVALPVLTRLGLRSTVYIVTEHLGGRSRWLTRDGEGERQMLSPGQVRDLDDAGVEIGAHGHRHMALDEIPFSMAVREIDMSRVTLEEIVGHGVATFAYPYGYHTGSIKRYLRGSGFESACAVKQAISHPDDDRFALARAIVGSDMSTDLLDSWIHGQGLPISWRGERPMTKAWRLARRLRRAAPARKPSDADAYE